jgi:pimeloyl-ACP methyl ester carboxylesterase
VPFYPEGAVERLQAQLDAGDREGVLTAIFCEIAGMPRHEFEQLRSLPTWPARVARANLLVRESWAETRYIVEPQRFRDVRVPVLLLSGGDSPRQLTSITETLHANLPDSRIAVMPGQQHIAMYTSPDLFVHEVLAFLDGTRN